VQQYAKIRAVFFLINRFGPFKNGRAHALANFTYLDGFFKSYIILLDYGGGGSGSGSGGGGIHRNFAARSFAAHV